MKKDIKILKKGDLSDYQKHIKHALIERGFADQDLNVRMNLLIEEVGELSKAIRKHTNERVGTHSQTKIVEEELADVFFVLLSIANLCKVDLADAFFTKETKNTKRKWK